MYTPVLVTRKWGQISSFWSADRVPKVSGRFLPILLCSLLYGLLSCGEAGPPQSSRSVACTLHWTGPADLDLTVDGQSASRVGGSPDMTHGGGTEAITIPETDPRETVVLGVANRSAEPGGSGEIQGFATLIFVRHDGSRITMEREMDTQPWTAAIVHPATGIVVPAP